MFLFWNYPNSWNGPVHLCNSYFYTKCNVPVFFVQLLVCVLDCVLVLYSHKAVQMCAGGYSGSRFLPYFLWLFTLACLCVGDVLLVILSTHTHTNAHCLVTRLLRQTGSADMSVQLSAYTDSQNTFYILIVGQRVEWIEQISIFRCCDGGKIPRLARLKGNETLMQIINSKYT